MAQSIGVQRNQFDAFMSGIVSDGKDDFNKQVKYIRETQMSNTIIYMDTSAKGLVKAFKELGISVRNTDRSMKTVAQVLKEISEKWDEI